MKAPEYWVMRVMLHRGKPAELTNMTPGAQVAVLALINTGAYALLPDHSIAEPVEVFDNEADAHEHREQLLRRYRTEDYRVILNADVNV